MSEQEEQLTDEEREQIDGPPYAARGAGDVYSRARVVAKLLRIHDRLKARVEEEDAKARATAKRVAAEIEYDGPCSQCGRGYPG